VKSHVQRQHRTKELWPDLQSGDPAPILPSSQPNTSQKALLAPTSLELDLHSLTCCEQPLAHCNARTARIMASRRGTTAAVLLASLCLPAFAASLEAYSTNSIYGVSPACFMPQQTATNGCSCFVRPAELDTCRAARQLASWQLQITRCAASGSSLHTYCVQAVHQARVLLLPMAAWQLAASSAAGTWHSQSNSRCCLTCVPRTSQRSFGCRRCK
jgi:hypothetical protein